MCEYDVKLFNRKYLKNVHIDANIKVKLMNVVHIGIFQYVSIVNQFPISNTVTNIWKSCKHYTGDSKCNQKIRKALHMELNSTAYRLRALQMMMIKTLSNGKRKLYIKISNPGKINGFWDNDKQYISIDTQHSELTSPKNYLIMGYGPSASGKTFMVKQIIKLIKMGKSVKFPKHILSIDGGILREASEIYGVMGINKSNNILKNNVQCFTKRSQWPGGIVSVGRAYGAGFSNLVSPGFSLFSKSMYSSAAKKQLFDFLVGQNDQQKMFFYIPETKPIYKKYMKLGKDGTIFLRIWQHKHESECTYSGEYKCAGTVGSGTTRALFEGKQYSSSGWKLSMKAESILKQATLYAFDIHNSGRPNGKSIVKDLSERKLFNKTKLIGNLKYN